MAELGWLCCQINCAEAARDLQDTFFRVFSRRLFIDNEYEKRAVSFHSEGLAKGSRSHPFCSYFAWKGENWRRTLKDYSKASDFLASYLEGQKVECHKKYLVQCILSIPTSQQPQDCSAWEFGGKGTYTAKSGNRIARRLKDVPECSNQKRKLGWWKILWRIKLPPNIKQFLWRLCKGWLAPRSNLNRRHIEVERFCPRCKLEEETIKHIFWNCERVKALYRNRGWFYREEGALTLLSTMIILVWALGQ
ncbi:conserved hypothetical protein [Ricinus communis]|uniref:Reverse transcriptase zinc-binding domain-containing protein n=1 Tax=Ricinus communis TaxID=3988 RepID=B9SS86_RICCO|nr:conserved hypothetical protein [Ricinus communis]